MGEPPLDIVAYSSGRFFQFRLKQNIAAWSKGEVLWGERFADVAKTDRAGTGQCCPKPAPAAFHFRDRCWAEACSARWARYDFPWVFRISAPSTIRSQNAIASGGSPRYSPQPWES